MLPTLHPPRPHLAARGLAPYRCSGWGRLAAAAAALAPQLGRGGSASGTPHRSLAAGIVVAAAAAGCTPGIAGQGGVTAPVPLYVLHRSAGVLTVLDGQSGRPARTLVPAGPEPVQAVAGAGGTFLVLSGDPAHADTLTYVAPAAAAPAGTAAAGSARAAPAGTRDGGRPGGNATAGQLPGQPGGEAAGGTTGPGGPGGPRTAAVGSTAGAGGPTAAAGAGAAGGRRGGSAPAAGWVTRPLPLQPRAQARLLAGDGAAWAAVLYVPPLPGRGCWVALVDLETGSLRGAYPVCAAGEQPSGLALANTTAGLLAYVSVWRPAAQPSSPLPGYAGSGSAFATRPGLRLPVAAVPAAPSPDSAPPRAAPGPVGAAVAAGAAPAAPAATAAAGGEALLLVVNLEDGTALRRQPVDGVPRATSDGGSLLLAPGIATGFPGTAAGSAALPERLLYYVAAAAPSSGGGRSSGPAQARGFRAPREWHLVALHPLSLAVQRDYVLPAAPLWLTVTPDGAEAFAVDGQYLSTDGTCRLLRVDLASGVADTIGSVPGEAMGGLVAAGDQVFVSDPNTGAVAAIDRGDGHLRWRVHLRRPPVAIGALAR